MRNQAGRAMTSPIANLFFRLAVVYGLIGMALGVHMGASGDHGLYPAHAHLNLLGWVSMAIYALFYRAWPAAAADRLAKIHLWLANIALVLFIPPLALVLLGREGWELVLGLGSVITLAGMILFAVIVFRATRR